MANEVLLHWCSGCESSLPATGEFFSRNKREKSGWAARCKACAKAAWAIYYELNRSKLIDSATARTKSRRATSATVRAADRDSSRERKRRSLSDPQVYNAHLERGRAWRSANPERVKLFKHMSHHHRAARQAARNASKMMATPAWANKLLIDEVYNECRRLNLRGPEVYEVDHIFPLRGKDVCGLHVHNNLQIISAEQNRKKSNRLPD